MLVDTNPSIDCSSVNFFVARQECETSLKRQRSDKKLRFNEAANEIYETVAEKEGQCSKELRWYVDADHDRFKEDTRLIAEELLTKNPTRAGLWLRTLVQTQKVCSGTKSEFSFCVSASAMSMDEQRRLADVYQQADEIVGFESVLLPNLRTEICRRQTSIGRAIRHVQKRKEKTMQGGNTEQSVCLISQTLSRPSRLFAKEIAEALAVALERELLIKICTK
jgi:hypothetical protein